MTATALQIRGVSRRFPGTIALDDVSFDVVEGSFHALLGGNGSGKSTLIKILAGVLSGDDGEMTAGGVRVAAARTTPAWARAAGVRFVHQDLGLFETLSVAENIALSTGFSTVRGRIDWVRVRRHAAGLLAAVGLDIAPRTSVAALGPAQQTMVAIARALDRSTGPIGMLVLDEPTARLPADAVDELLPMLRGLAAGGTTIFYVTHRLNEVLQVADRITVLRDGRHVETRPLGGLDEDGLVELIVGRPIDAIFPEAAPAAPTSAAAPEMPPTLTVSGLAGAAVRDVDLTVRAGEVVGVGGTIGAGRTSLLRLLFGDVPKVAGRVLLDGEEFAPRSPAAAMRAGVAYVPEDRARDAAFESLGVTENLAAATVGLNARMGLLRRGRERLDADRDVAALGIRTSSVAAPLRSLSGGNQQKVILGRWLRLKTRVLLLDEPTQGVDVGARAEIYGLIRGAAGEGVATLVVSSDFEELAGICDRVLVMADGRIVAAADGEQVSADWIAHHTHAASLGGVA